MRDEKIIIFVGSLIAVAFGWILNEVSHWLRVRKEDKKKIKEVLYNLLETFHLFISSNIEIYVDIISKKVMEKLPKENQSKEVNQFLNQIYLNFVQEYLKPILFDRLNEIKKNYQSSVNSLAQIDPILAYIISDKTTIIDYFEELGKWISCINKRFSKENEEFQSKGKFVIAKIKSELMNEALEELKDDIYKVAWKINPIIWYKSRQIIKYAKEKKIEAAEEKIDELFNKFEKFK